MLWKIQEGKFIMRTNLGEGVYIGGAYGENAPYGDHTHLGDIFHTPDTQGILMDYPEV